MLERVPTPRRARNYLVRFTCPEFTSLCPLTGQPDFAHLVIDYIPGDWIVESKSLKLFLGSFRNHGAFHEACTMQIAERLVALLRPVWLRIGGYWYPRGGMPIDVFWQTGAPPEGAWIPPQECRAVSWPGLTLRRRPSAHPRQGAGAGLRRRGLLRAPSSAPKRAQRLADFLAAGQHGDMGWLAERAEQRSHPRSLWPEARSVIALGLSYAPEDDPLADPRPARIAAPSRSMPATATTTTW